MAPLIAFATSLLIAPSPADDPRPVRFREDVAPILVSRCIGCHHDGDEQGGLNMSTFSLLKEGGAIEGDLILLPGEPGESHLVRVLLPDADIRMPFEQDPLTDEEIDLISRWVAEGAIFDGPSEDARISSLIDPLTNLPEVPVTAAVADPVASVAFSPDGSRLAAARGTNVLIINPIDGSAIATLTGHEGPVNAVAFAPDGRSLIAAGGRAGMFGAVAVWDLGSGERISSWRGHADAVLSAALSPDGTRLATSSYDRMVMLWDVESGDQFRVLKEHTDAVYAVAFSPDGTRVASASGDRTVKLWEAATGRRIVSLGDASAELYVVAFGPGGSTILAGGADRTIWQWHLSGESGSLVRSTIAHDAAVLELLVSPDGSAVYSTGEDLGVKRWSLPDLAPLSALPRQPDWPIAAALSPSEDRIALGRYDGSLALLPASSDAAGVEPVTLLDAPQAEDPDADSKEPEPKAPELVRRPSLGPPAPRGAQRGTTITLNLSGNGVGLANEVVFDDPALSARILPSETPDPNRLQVELTIAPDARIGRHSFQVQTPLGVPASQGFLVTKGAEQAEAEPNNAPDQATVATIPATLSGLINTPGDVDCFRLEAKAGQTLVLLDRGGAIGSGLDPALEVLDAGGRIVARGRTIVSYRAEAKGPLTLRVADRQFGGSGNHIYRIEAGEIPVLERAFPVGVEIGSTAEVAISGSNLSGETVPVSVPGGIVPGTLLPVPALGPGGRPAEGGPKVVAAGGPQAIEQEPNDELCCGLEIAVPGGVSGRIDAPGDVDHVAFEAHRGRPVIVEVFGSRLGTEIDPILEILDSEGEPIPMAVLRPVARSSVAFIDHNATQPAVRLSKWDELAQDDYVLFGRELARIFALPRNPDDNAVLWSADGRRLAYLGTTPEQHPQDQPFDKVEIHPPGTTFPPGGAEPVTLFFRNDDAPFLGKDSALTFDPPADGTYLIRVADARGLGGEGFGYHVVLRDPRPDFFPSMSTENPDIPRGGGSVVTVNVRRIDGFDGPIDVRFEDLPMGITATSARVERGHFSTDVLLSASNEAPTFSPPTWRVIAEASMDGSSGELLRHELDPGGPRGGWITVTPEPDLAVRTDRDLVVIRPGDRVELTFRIDRSEAFSGRVPIDVRNLPHGVRVLNIGLNGVLITESEVERTVFLYAEPWVTPTERPIFAVGRVEAAGTESAAPPITLVVSPQGN
jgi:hypothetical protein